MAIEWRRRESAETYSFPRDDWIFMVILWAKWRASNIHFAWISIWVYVGGTSNAQIEKICSAMAARNKINVQIMEFRCNFLALSQLSLGFDCKFFFLAGCQHRFCTYIDVRTEQTAISHGYADLPEFFNVHQNTKRTLHTLPPTFVTFSSRIPVHNSK